jgi:hypothetical protein
MSRTPSRLALAPIVAVLVVAGATVAPPVTAADSPEAAVSELFDILASGDFAALDTVVCAADRDVISETFDVATQLGLDSEDPLAGALALEMGDRSVELIGQEGDSATVAVRATMSMSVAEDQIEDLVRAIIAADQGPDDPPPSDEDVEMMMGFMGSAFNQAQRLDEEVSVVREEGEWRVCGGLVEPAEEPMPAEQPWQSEGLCGLLDMETVNAAGALQYATATGFDTVCTLSSSMADIEGYHTATLALDEGHDYQTFQQMFGMDEELEVAGYPAFAAGDQVFVQVGDDMLQVSVYLGEEPPADVDAVSQAVGLAELVIPRLSEIATPTPEPTPVTTPEVPLCEGLSLDELNELTGLAFEQAEGDASSCQYMSLGGEGGFHFVVAYAGESDLETYRLWVTDYEETTIAGLPAMVTGQQTLVELPDGARVLDITVVLDSSDDVTTMTAAEIGALVAERLLPGLLER